MNAGPTDIVEKILSDDVELLRKAIREIEAKIKERKEIARDLMGQLSEDIADLADRDEKLAIWGPGYKSSVDRTRGELRSRIHILKSEARNQELNFWRDTTALEKELRILTAACEKALRKREIMGESDDR